MTQDDTQPWFQFTVHDTEAAGVDIPKLARLLMDLSAAFYAIARAKKGKAGPRPGRRALAEEELAAFRLLRVEPGSATIELAPPPTDGQGKLPLFDEPTAEDVAFEFYREIESIDAGEPTAEDRLDLRRQVRVVIDDAGQIGSRAEVVYRPRTERPGILPGRVLKTSFRTVDLPEPEPLPRSVRTRHVSGHTYMVDVEPGRERLRVKLPDGRDMTLDVDADLASKMSDALDRVVDIEVEEEIEAGTPARRVVHDLAIVPLRPVTDRPSISIEELEREQGLPAERPDYVALPSRCRLTSSLRFSATRAYHLSVDSSCGSLRVTASSASSRFFRPGRKPDPSNSADV